MRNAVLVQAEGAQRTRSALILSGNGCGPRTLVWRGPRGPRGFLGSRAAAEPTLGPAGFSCAAIDLQLEEPRHRPQVLDDSYPPCGSPLPGERRPPVS